MGWRTEKETSFGPKWKVLNICHKVKVNFSLFFSFIPPFSPLLHCWQTHKQKKMALASLTVCLAFRMIICSNTGKKPFASFALNYKSRQLLFRTLIQCPAFRSCLSSLQRVFISISSPKPFNSYQKKKGKILKCLKHHKKAQLLWQVLQPIKLTFSLWGAIAHNDTLLLDPTTQGDSSSVPEFQSVVWTTNPRECCRISAESRVMFSHPCWQCQNWWPTRFHHHLDPAWTKFLMTTDLLWVPAHFLQVTKSEHWDLECAGNCLDSIVCWTEMNCSDPFKTPPRYQLSQECREKEHTCWRNRTMSDLEPKKLLFPRGRRVYSSLAHTSHTLSQLWERERCQKTRGKFRSNTENLSYGSLVTIPPC